MEKVTLKNVVIANKNSRAVFKNGWDFKGLAKMLDVVCFENNEFIQKQYMIDDNFGEHVEVDLKFVDNIEEMQEKYRKYVIYQRCEESKRQGHSANAKIGDTIEVYKGRKFPKGTRFVIKSETTWQDRYGRNQAWYWITECGKKVDKFNCIIVG